jgi:hypothetical protein
MASEVGLPDASAGGTKFEAQVGGAEAALMKTDIGSRSFGVEGIPAVPGGTPN